MKELVKFATTVIPKDWITNYELVKKKGVPTLIVGLKYECGSKTFLEDRTYQFNDWKNAKEVFDELDSFFVEKRVNDND